MNILRRAFWFFATLLGLQYILLFSLYGYRSIGLFATTIWGAVLGLITLTGAVLAIIYRKRIWHRDEAFEKLQRLRIFAKRQFRQIRERAKAINRQPMSVPWNVFLAMERHQQGTTMDELGYVRFGTPLLHEGLAVTTWTSPTAVAYRIEITPGTDLSFDLIEMLLHLLKSNRPGLAINGVYVEYDLAKLLSPATVESDNISSINRILNVACKSCDVDIPLHVAIGGLEHLPDLYRAALLSGQLGDQTIFGGFLNGSYSDQGDNIDSLFDELIRALNENQLDVLQKQIDPGFCASIVNAPLQLALIRSQVRDRLGQLTKALPPRRKTLNLQSIAFVGASRDMRAVDPLGQVSGQRFFQSQPEFSHVTVRTNSVTSASAGMLAEAYHRESFSVNQNNQVAVRSRYKATAFTVVLLVGLGVLAALIKENHSSYAEVNDQMATALEDYYEQSRQISEDSESLVDHVRLLSPLREGLEDYRKLDAQVHRRWLPSSSMYSTYLWLYQEELTGTFQHALADYLEKDIFAYNSLEDGVELVKLAALDTQFRGDQKSNAAHLTQYYTSSFAEHGEVSNTFQNSFTFLLNDLFELNQPLTDRNEELHQVVAKTLVGLEPAKLLYEALIRRDEFSRRTDLRQQIGSRFLEVFKEIDSPRAFYVPQGYTRAGFDSLFRDGGMPDLDILIDSYQSVIGSMDNIDVNIVSRKVAERYTADYIATWTTFLDALQIRTANDWADAQILMKALTHSSENPVSGLVITLQTNTDITLKASDKAKGEPSKDVKATSYNIGSVVSQSIRNAFRTYLTAANRVDQKESQIDLFLRYSQEVALWLEEMAGAPDGARYALFEQFQASEQANPLAKLSAFTSRSELEIIRTLGHTITTTLDKAAMGHVYDYIDSQWQTQIWETYATQLENSFPFASSSSVDLPLPEFTELFGRNGKIQSFQKTYLKRFVNSEGTFRPQSTFLPSGTASLTDQAGRAFEKASKIQESMFADGKPFLSFDARISYMDRHLSRLNISSGVTLVQFSHGPVIWRDQDWPVSGVRNGDLTLRLSQRSSTVLTKTYKGAWSWFRLVEGGKATTNPSQGLANVAFDAGDNSVVLQLKTRKRFTPFAPGFFSSFQLPYSLFDPQMQNPRNS